MLPLFHLLLLLLLPDSFEFLLFSVMLCPHKYFLVEASLVLPLSITHFILNLFKLSSRTRFDQSKRHFVQSALHSEFAQFFVFFRQFFYALLRAGIDRSAQVQLRVESIDVSKINQLVTLLDLLLVHVQLVSLQMLLLKLHHCPLGSAPPRFIPIHLAIY